MPNARLPPTAIVAAPGLGAGDWELLLREAYHRTKNTLALLGAWLRLDLASAESANFPEAVDI